MLPASNNNPPPNLERVADSMSINHALGGWLTQLRIQWFAPIDPPLRLWRRFLYASFGTFFWAAYLAITNITSSESLGSEIAAAMAVAIDDELIRAALFLLVPGLFAWLVSWPYRPYSPTRLFLGGLLLPALATAIARFSLLEWLLTGENSQ